MYEKKLAIGEMKFKTTLRFYLSMLSEQQSPIKQDPAKTGYEPWEKNACAPLVGRWISSPST